MTHIRLIAEVIRHPWDFTPPSLEQRLLDLAPHYRNTSIVAVNVRYEQNNADLFSLIGIQFIHDTKRDHRDLPEHLKQLTRDVFDKLFAQLNQHKSQYPTGFPPTPGLFRWDLRRHRLEDIQSIRLRRRRPKIISNWPPCTGFRGPLPKGLIACLKSLGEPDTVVEMAPTHSNPSRVE